MICPICGEKLEDIKKIKEAIILDLEKENMGGLTKRSFLFLQFAEEGICPFCGHSIKSL
jgi:hypothetical protein